MIDKDCSSSLIFGIVCQLARGSLLLTTQIDKHGDLSSLKMKGKKNSNRCWFEKILVCLTANC